VNGDAAPNLGAGGTEPRPEPARTGGRHRDGVVSVLEVGAPATYPLRQRILRPHQALSEVAFESDNAPDSVHLAVIDAAGSPVGVVSLLAEPAPTGEGRAWRLRGMAVDEGHRGRGVGTALFGAVERRVAERGGGVLWCAARLSAEEFYLRQGMTRVGKEWDEPFIGRHVAMLLRVPAAR
jgi:GNAT superfamily N-acetyltransferase